MIINTKVVVIALMGGLAGLGQPAWARPNKMEPSYYYTTFDKVKYDTWQAAYDSINPHWSARPDPGTGLVHWRVVGVQAPSKPVVFINGRLANQRLKWEHREYKNDTKSYEWTPTAGGPSPSIDMIPECPTGYRMVFSQKASPDVLDNTYACQDENPQPEPECDPCAQPGRPDPIPEKKGTRSTTPPA